MQVKQRVYREMEESTLQEILESTVAVARGLEALQSRHEALITDFYATDNADSSAEEGRPTLKFPTCLLCSLVYTKK